MQWKEGASYISGRVKKIYERAVKSINAEFDKDFLIRQENGAMVIKSGHEIEKI